MIKEKILHQLKKTVNLLGLKSKKIFLDLSPNEKFGDYSSPIALQLARDFQKNPLDLANLIRKKFISADNDIIEKVEVVKPGFINFFLKDKYLIKNAFNLINTDLNLPKNNQKILIEFGQPNTHKIPHIGHLFSYIYGESLSRIFESAGFKVIRANYQGDVGLHVAKCLYQVKKEIAQISKLKTLEDKVSFLQLCYQKGSTAYEKNPEAKKEIDKINEAIYQEKKEVINLWQKTRDWSLKFYHQFEKKLDIKYDRSYFESQTSFLGKKIVNSYLNKIFKKSQNAIIFPGEKYHLHTRVFINQVGNPTYEAKDLGLFQLKINDYPNLNLYLTTTANEQNDYWRVIIKVLELIFPKYKNKIKHLGFGMVQLTEGKMSSREGKIIDPFNLINHVKNSITEKFKIKDKKLVEKIALASIKYSFLNSDYKKNIVFDINKSIVKEGNSGPYLLYTYVRTHSLMKKDSKKNVILPKNKNIYLNPEEKNLFRLINYYPEIIKISADRYQPHLLTHYLYQLANNFNLFYQKHPILKTEKDIKEIRILITKTVSKILKHGLNLLGIKTVKKM